MLTGKPHRVDTRANAALHDEGASGPAVTLSGPVAPMRNAHCGLWRRPCCELWRRPLTAETHGGLQQLANLTGLKMRVLHAPRAFVHVFKVAAPLKGISNVLVAVTSGGPPPARVVAAWDGHELGTAQAYYLSSQSCLFKSGPRWG